VSEQNVQIVRRGWEHFVANGEPLDELFAPSYVLDLSTFRDWTEGFDDWRIEIIAYRDAGNRVVTLLHQWGQSASSGVPVELIFGHVFTVNDDLITRQEFYAEPAEALKAVGLEE
jgi:hypothetical protein